jgi:pantetheine-phosphate adenylyltransferase
MTAAIFPGSFDPFHNGHLEIVERAHRLFERVIVAVLANSEKLNPTFDPEEREATIRESVADFANVEVVQMSTLVVEVARLQRADVIIRGLRAVSDFENELQMSQMNHQLSGIETLFIPTGATYSFISSRLIREVAAYGGDVSHFVPPPVLKAIEARRS